MKKGLVFFDMVGVVGSSPISPTSLIMGWYLPEEPKYFPTFPSKLPYFSKSGKQMGDDRSYIFEIVAVRDKAPAADQDQMAEDSGPMKFLQHLPAELRLLVLHGGPFA